jgi:hypothetical protein
MKNYIQRLQATFLILYEGTEKKESA